MIHKDNHLMRENGKNIMFKYCVLTGADPGFDQGGPQIVTGLKLPFWGLSFVEFWCWGLIFGGQGGPRPPGPPLDPPLIKDEIEC